MSEPFKDGSGYWWFVRDGRQHGPFFTEAQAHQAQADGIKKEIPCQPPPR